MERPRARRTRDRVTTLATVARALLRELTNLGSSSAVTGDRSAFVLKEAELTLPFAASDYAVDSVLLGTDAPLSVTDAWTRLGSLKVRGRVTDAELRMVPSDQLRQLKLRLRFDGPSAPSP